MVTSGGYKAFGWLAEIDPTTAEVKQYRTGTSQKLWAMGRMPHENACFSEDNKTAYFGADAGRGYVYKFVADNEEDLSEGKLYVLKIPGLNTTTTDLTQNQVRNVSTGI